MKKLLALAAVAVLATGCSRTAMYDAPDADDVAADITVTHHFNDGSGGDDAAAGGFQMPMASAPARAEVFLVDGERTNEAGGDNTARVKPGEHTVQVVAEDGAVLRFGDVTWEFQGDHDYVIHIYNSDKPDSEYRAELVDAAQPDKVLKKVYF